MNVQRYKVYHLINISRVFIIWLSYWPSKLLEDDYINAMFNFGLVERVLL